MERAHLGGIFYEEKRKGGDTLTRYYANTSPRTGSLDSAQGGKEGGYCLPAAAVLAGAVAGGGFPFPHPRPLEPTRWMVVLRLPCGFHISLARFRRTGGDAGSRRLEPKAGWDDMGHGRRQEGRLGIPMTLGRMRESLVPPAGGVGR